MKFIKDVIIKVLNKINLAGGVQKVYIQRRLHDERLNQELLPVLSLQLNTFLEQELINYTAIISCQRNGFDNLDIEKVSDNTLVGIFSNSQKPSGKKEIYFFTYDVNNFYYRGSVMVYIEGSGGPYYTSYFPDISGIHNVFFEIQMGYMDAEDNFEKTSSLGYQVRSLNNNSHMICKFIPENITYIKSLEEVPTFNFEFE